MKVSSAWPSKPARRRPDMVAPGERAPRGGAHAGVCRAVEHVELGDRPEIGRARADDRIGRDDAGERRFAIVADLRQLAGGQGVSHAGIDAHAQAGTADEGLDAGLGEPLRRLLRAEQRELGPLAELGQRIQPADEQRLPRAGQLVGAVVGVEIPADHRARDLRHQPQRARFALDRLQHAAHPHAGHIRGEQQGAFHRGGRDRPFLLHPFEEAQHLRAGRADIAVEADLGDIALGDREARLGAPVGARHQRGGDRDEGIARPAIGAEQGQPHLLQPRQGDGLALDRCQDGAKIGALDRGVALHHRGADGDLLSFTGAAPRLGRRWLGAGRQVGCLRRQDAILQVDRRRRRARHIDRHLRQRGARQQPWPSPASEPVGRTHGPSLSRARNSILGFAKDRTHLKKNEQSIDEA